MVDKRAQDRRLYGILRGSGASHEVAVLKVARGNWNPYTETAPTPTTERLAEVEENVR